MINNLSEENRKAVETIVRNLFDPDYVKLTPSKRKDLENASEESETITHDELVRGLDLD